MSVATFDVNSELVRVTPAAAEHFRSSLAGGERAAVRISLQESGCTGYKYVVEEVDAGADSDVKIELENGVRLFLDTGAVAILRGTEIDYAREGINYNLKFRNPNVVAECGCGESFNVE
jgi:iron-sulfur cluster assembly accessory protein